MNSAVQILVEVPVEAQTLSHAIESFRRFGTPIVYDVTGSPEVAAVASVAEVELVLIPWTADFGAVFNAILADRPDQVRLIVHADEIVEQTGEQLQLTRLAAPGVIISRHRINSSEYYNEEQQVRAIPPGTEFMFQGRYAPELYRNGQPVSPAEMIHLPMDIGHFPARWPGLAGARIQRVIEAMEAALAEQPDNLNHLYALLFRYWTVNEWERVLALSARWRQHAAADDPHWPLVEYCEACAAVVKRNIRAAEQLVRSALQRADHFADAWYLLGTLRRLRRDRTGAAQAFQRAAEIGLEAEPVAVEDYSLATWQPLLELAEMAVADGDPARAQTLREQAERVRQAAVTARASMPAEEL